MIKLLLIFVLFSGMVNAQDFKKYQWKNRLVVIYSDDFEDLMAKRQWEVLISEAAHLADRKIVVYHLTSIGYRKGPQGKMIRQKNLVKVNKPFKVELIGLDGSVKFSSDEVQPLETFNSLIDQMPMRRAELKGRKGQ